MAGTRLDAAGRHVDAGPGQAAIAVDPRHAWMGTDHDLVRPRTPVDPRHAWMGAPRVTFFPLAHRK